MSDKTQTEFTETYRFASRCVHCGKPMQEMSINRFDRAPYPGSPFELRDVFVMWIDPQHECTYLDISPKPDKVAA